MPAWLKLLPVATLFAAAALAGAPGWTQTAPSAAQAARFTGLHAAAQRGDLRLLEAALAAGADVNGRAAVADDEETLHVLLALGASAKLITSRYDGTALIAAAHLGHDGVVRQLIAAGAPLNHVNNLHWTALIEAIVLGDGGARHQAVLKALLAAGADTSLADRDGLSPLDLARARRYAPMVATLVQAGAK